MWEKKEEKARKRKTETKNLYLSDLEEAAWNFLFFFFVPRDVDTVSLRSEAKRTQRLSKGRRKRSEVAEHKTKNDQM